MGYFGVKFSEIGFLGVKMDSFVVVGVDPGVSGGAVAVRRFGGESRLLLAGSLPHRRDDHALFGTAGRKNVLDLHGLSLLLDYAHLPVSDRGELECCVIERQQFRGGQGGMAQVLVNFGRLSAFCEDRFGEDMVFYASAASWKKDLGLGRDKQASRRLATEVFGTSRGEKYWPRRGDDGVAEAALLAHWRALTIEGMKGVDAA